VAVIMHGSRSCRVVPSVRPQVRTSWCAAAAPCNMSLTRAHVWTPRVVTKRSSARISAGRSVACRTPQAVAELGIQGMMSLWLYTHACSYRRVVTNDSGPARIVSFVTTWLGGEGRRLVYAPRPARSTRR
jgi:hypothetical protein